MYILLGLFLELRKRVRQKMVQGNLQLSQEDTLNEALELDQVIKWPLKRYTYMFLNVDFPRHNGVP